MKYMEGLTAEKVIKVTYPNGDKEPPKLSPKAKLCMEKIKGNFGCQETSVAKLVSAILGEDIIPHMNTVTPPVHTAVVLLSNPNSHNYPRNTVLIVSYDDYCVSKSGHQGNHAPFQNPGAWRRATKEEILKAFDADKKKTSKTKVPVKKATVPVKKTKVPVKKSKKR